MDIDHALKEKFTHAKELSHFGENSLQDVLEASLDLFITNRPHPIKREVTARYKFQCTFTSKSGHRCEEKQALEYHHLQAFALGGEHTPANLTLLCRKHNQFDAEQTFSAQVISKWRSIRPIL